MAKCAKCNKYVNLFDAFFLKGKSVHFNCEDEEILEK